MSSAFERSLRGSSSTPSTERSSSKPAEARKKKSVRWDDDKGGARQSSCDSSGNGGVLRVSTGPNASLGPIAEQRIDHLRVPSSRPVSGVSRADTARSHDQYGAASAAASGGRKRVGERGIQAGAVRVRTPAKPKRARPDGMPPSTTASASAAVATASSSGQHETAVRGPRATPHSYLRRGGVTGGLSPNTSPSRRPRPVGAPNTATSPKGPSNGKLSPPLRSSPHAPRPAALASPRRRISSSQALRNVAGGNAEDTLDDSHMEDENESPAEVSPMSLLSSTLSSIGLAGTGGKPPRSPRASRSPKPGGSPRASRLPRASGSPRAMDRGGLPKTGAVASGASERGFFSCEAGPEERLDDDEDEDDSEVRCGCGNKSTRSRLDTREPTHTHPIGSPRFLGVCLGGG